jgi:hypothetical protein
MMVALVLDQSFDGLSDLVERMPVWAVNGPKIRALAENIWAASEPWSSERGLTLFNAVETKDREDECLGQIEMLEWHHPDASALLLIGLANSPKLRDGLSNLGYDLELHEEELIARRRSDTSRRGPPKPVASN